MELKTGGVDIFYVDESERFPLSVVSAIRVPFLRQVDGVWTFVWQGHLGKAVLWRRSLSEAHDIRSRAELHGYEILSHRGLLRKGRQNLRPDQAVELYSNALRSIDFLPESSIITVYAGEGSSLMGQKGIRAAMLGLFQRIKRQCGNDTHALLIFDDGHPEYVSWFRQATRYLPTGSNFSGWAGKATTNIPLDMSPGDANLKASNQSLFLQVADLVVYAARLKIEYELGRLQEKRVKRGHGTIYDVVSADLINLAATGKRKDGLVPI